MKEGSKAPQFTLLDKDGNTVSLRAANSDFTVLYFYPKDNTPGCTIEAQEFSMALKDFKARKAAVIGISGGDQKSKQKFCEKYSLTVPLVSDSDFAVSKAYKVYGDKKFMGRTFKGIHRKTFIIDKRGVVARVFDTVKPAGHASEVLAALDDLRQSAGGALRRKVTSESEKTKPLKKSAVPKSTTRTKPTRSK